MEPLEVIVHWLSASRGRAAFERLIIASPQLGQRPGTDYLQPSEVVSQLVPFDFTSRPLTQFHGGAPLLLLLLVQLAIIEGGRLIADFRRGDVREKRTDRIALWVVQVVEFVQA